MLLKARGLLGEEEGGGGRGGRGGGGRGDGGGVSEKMESLDRLNR